ncbi:sodium:proton antiporter [Xylanimonas oleitrophica]|uniref:Sodium:proton antiporter n=1 Tax=Xylanimonas oleitrophica TaxID=2607479 RepID=A0A2W5WUT0_9MICO|nr:Na+/H+ antiporter subunit E [Xylanimonas oleitrophica]PZR55037.1 sodium:proton antiporter [Xylanimonas oleitrophica]
MSWITWPLRWAWFVLWFLGQVVASNVKVIRDSVTPGQASTPCVARYPSRCRTEAEVTLLGAAITLTPGTLTLGARAGEGDRPEADAPGGAGGAGGADGADEARWTLYVHGMYADGPDELRAEVRRIEEHMLRATRREGADR